MPVLDLTDGEFSLLMQLVAIGVHGARTGEVDVVCADWVSDWDRAERISLEHKLAIPIVEADE